MLLDHGQGRDQGELPPWAWPMPDQAKGTATRLWPQMRRLGLSLRIQPLGAPRPLHPPPCLWQRPGQASNKALRHGSQAWGDGPRLPESGLAPQLGWLARFLLVPWRTLRHHRLPGEHSDPPQVRWHRRWHSCLRIPACTLCGHSRIYFLRFIASLIAIVGAGIVSGMNGLPDVCIHRSFRHGFP